MDGTKDIKRKMGYENKNQIVSYRPSILMRRANLTVKFQDIYGFTVEGNVDDVNILNEVREKIRQQGRVWWSMEASKGENWYIHTQAKLAIKPSLKLTALGNAITLKRLLRKGIPPVLRPKIWFALSGAEKKKSTVPDSYYGDLIKATEGMATPATKQIDHGLNYVAALLLLVMKSEEDVLVNDCYSNNLSGCHVEQRVFQDLLTKKCPGIAAHLEALEFDVSLVATEWFLCLFSKSLPSETTLRVWDVLFYEGAQVLFNVALAIFKMKEDELLLAHHIGDVLNILQKTTHHMFDPDDLLTVAFDKIGSMTTNTISKQRKKQEPAVMAELDQRLRRLNSMNDHES